MKAFDLRAFERDYDSYNERNDERSANRNRDRQRNDQNNDQRNDQRNDQCNREEAVACKQEAVNTEVLGANRNNLSPTRLREECIIAFKVYDSCRQQDCLGENEIGPARAAECICIDGVHLNEGDVINPPNTAAAVTIDRLKIKKIIIVDKRPNTFRRGFWDIDLKYVFQYRLTFREANGQVILTVRANSIFNKKLTLFGSVGEDLVVATDLLDSTMGGGTTLDADPFVLVEAKAVALEATLRYQRRVNDGCEDFSPVPVAVNVTIGLFTIIKLYRIVNLTVESRGFCIPNECDDISSLEPCNAFDDLDFPMDSFAPPQRPEFLAGITNNIPRNHDRCNNKPCGCNKPCSCKC